LLPALIQSLREMNASEIQVICGGILPPQDHEFLKDAGVAALFTPGTPVLGIVREVLGKIGEALTISLDEESNVKV
jgi:methylmalonyl-CoA mutase